MQATLIIPCSYYLLTGLPFLCVLVFISKGLFWKEKIPSIMLPPTVISRGVRWPLVLQARLSD